MIDLAALRSLRAVADSGTLARAATELGFTPSAVSQQIKRLERQLGAPVLAPAGRGVVLTPAGRALVDSSGEVFAALERATTAARSVAGGTPTGVVHIAAFSTAIRGLVAPRLRSLFDQCPDLEVRVTEQDPVQALASVDAGTADLALVHDADGLPVPAPTTVQQRVIHTDIGDVTVPDDHSLARHGRLTGSDLVDVAWVTSPPGTVCHQWFRRLFADSGHEPAVHHVADDFATQMSLVAAGGVVALVPRLARPAVPSGLTVVELATPPTREVRAVWRESSGESPAVQAVVAALQPRSAP